MATVSKYQTAGGTTLYRVRYRTPDHRQTDKRGFKTKRDAESFASSVEVKKMRGEYVAPTLGRVTVGELGPAWLERQRGHMKPSGFRSYESAWRIHVQPRWGTTRIADIAYTDVQAWVSELAGRRGPVTTIRCYSILKQMLDDAAKDRLVAANPAQGVKLPAKVKRPNIYLTAEQLRALAVESGRYGSLVVLLGVVGLRWGEAAALHVQDVDFLKRRITLHQNAVSVGGKVYVGSLKSGKHRTVGIPAFVLDELAATCRGRERGDLIWVSASGGHLGPPAATRSWLSGAVERCQRAAETQRSMEIKKTGEPITPAFPRISAHDLRHTAASLAIASGASVKVVQRMLGHASAAMTLDVYADLFDSDLTAVADKLSETVGKMWA